jgi:hypothetical protein
LYSLGVIAYRLLTGKDGLPKVDRRRPCLDGVPSAYRPALARCLEPSPAKRFASVDALLLALEIAGRSRRSWRAYAAGCLGVLVLFGALAAGRHLLGASRPEVAAAHATTLAPSTLGAGASAAGSGALPEPAPGAASGQGSSPRAPAANDAPHATDVPASNRPARPDAAAAARAPAKKAKAREAPGRIPIFE